MNTSLLCPKEIRGEGLICSARGQGIEVRSLGQGELSGCRLSGERWALRRGFPSQEVCPAGHVAPHGDVAEGLPPADLLRIL